MGHTRDQVEKAILWRLGDGPRSPVDLTDEMARAGFVAADVRNCYARMLDRGVLECLGDLSLKIRSPKKRRSPEGPFDWSREEYAEEVTRLAGMVAALEAELAQLKQDLAETTDHAIDCEKSCEELVAEKAELERSYEALHREADRDARLAAADRAELAQLRQPAQLIEAAERLMDDAEFAADLHYFVTIVRNDGDGRVGTEVGDFTLSEAYAKLTGGRHG